MTAVEVTAMKMAAKPAVATMTAMTAACICGVRRGDDQKH
jgi:hypothetical protein